MISKFRNDENGYKEWVGNYEFGYVFNFFGGRDSAYNLVHKANCRTLRRKTDDGSRTAIEKVCSTDLKVLSDEATRLRGSSQDWSMCKICFKAVADKNVGAITSATV